MKKWLLLLGMAAFVAGCSETQLKEEISEETDQNEEVVEHSGWGTDFGKAQAQAKEEGKHLLIDFSGSDWCGWCIKLDKEVFSQKAFIEYANDNLVLLLADFPRDKSKQSAELQKQNEGLAEKYNVGGFPTVFILSPDGKLVNKTGYQPGGPEAYVDYIKNVIAGEEMK
jgi:protein disulfide-isomerase